MDAFKVPEIARMDKGGNNNWKTFFDEHAITKLEARTFEECTIGDRYSGDVGEEWKERLTAKVEEKEYVAGPRNLSATVASKASSAAEPRSTASLGKDQRGKKPSGSPLRSLSPASSIGPSAPTSKKLQNETYFAKLGSENASRTADLPPSQGGRYAGFGSEPPPAARDTDQKSTLPGVEEFQKDPMAALTKGFGWFTTTVGKSAKTVNESYIQPTAQKVYLSHSPYTSVISLSNIHLQLAEADLATQARLKATQVAQNIQSSTKTASDSFSRFVEGEAGHASVNSSRSRNTVDPDKRDFWDSFAAAAEERSNTASKPSGIGTAAMRKEGSGAIRGSAKKEMWEEEKWENF